MPTGVYKRNPFTDEHRSNISKVGKKRGMPRETIEKARIANLGNKQSPELIKRRLLWMKDYKMSEETKRKIGLTNSKKPHLKGEDHPNWLGGKSFEPYGLAFNKDLKNIIRTRDKKCMVCGKLGKEKLSVHHIDYNKHNNNPNNLISLCRSCHIKTNYKRENWLEYFKNI